jgi:hypothetical protein
VTTSPPPLLEDPYRSTALVAGTVRYFGWLFAAPEARDPLLGVFALLSEWRALAVPGTEPSVAQVKLGWWQQEIARLSSAQPVHPITRFLRGLPGADRVSFTPLERTLGALSRELETGGAQHDLTIPLPELEAQGEALGVEPLRLVAKLSQGAEPAGPLAASIISLAVGQYLAARAGKLEPSETPQQARVRERAAERLASVPASLPADPHAPQRHLAVMAALEHKHLYARTQAGRRTGVGDLFTAWRTARRAARRR